MLSLSILAFRLFCTSRLPSFLAYQIEANIATGKTITSLCVPDDSANGSSVCPSGPTAPHQPTVAHKRESRGGRDGRESVSATRAKGDGGRGAGKERLPQSGGGGAPVLSTWKQHLQHQLRPAKSSLAAPASLKVGADGSGWCCLLPTPKATHHPMRPGIQ